MPHLDVLHRRAKIRKPFKDLMRVTNQIGAGSRCRSTAVRHHTECEQYDDRNTEADGQARTAV
jgi:hypothetical protein